ncbi:hypothetical protein BU23DRAFT_599525 [Bimuria novae-zelandiae CBS 107.79]|uniref:Mid2 domain-containing protein n=1 Tax=Bimuria novae-zelandiae CBS 107.79 TaxID=1447943 RepID=A0A6A5V6P0_9PLEO|nr:hypothetical protein BU23DRAFT_599525 [Bimuria novae-zelandiae CBS 107.79]
MQGLTTALSLATSLLSLATAADVSVRTRNAPGYTDADTHLAIRRGLAEAKHQKREELGGNVTLDRSWDGAVLLKMATSRDIDTGNNASSASVNAGVEIICTTCYVKGLASVQLNIADDFDAGEALNKTVDSVYGTVKNFTTEVEEYIENYIKGVATNFEDGIDWHDFAFPTLNYTFDMDIKPINDVMLNFQFDNMELYLELNTILGAGATYELNLYTSNTPIGIGVGKDLRLGVVFQVDLLLSVEGELDISSGVHIKLDDGVAIDIALFSDAVSNIVFNGGQFEFLPVTVEKAGVVLSAILRMGIHSGITVAPPEPPEFTAFNSSIGLPKVGGGIEVGIYANLAEFTTNVTLAPDNDECELKVVQEYQIALGAAAGASVVFDTDTWGPVAATSIPIWNTVLAEVCAKKGTKTDTPATVTAAPTPTGGARKRDDEESETITTKTTITHTGVRCMTSVIGNCPNSLQTTGQETEIRTLTTVVPSGKEVKWPKTLGVIDSIPTTASFGENALSLASTSGSPTSYTPPPTSKPQEGTGDDDNDSDVGSKASKIVNGKTGSVSNKVIIGVSVGAGAVVIISIIAAVVLMRRRKAYNAVPAPNFAPDNLVAEPYQRVVSHGNDDGFEPYRFGDKTKAKPSVDITEIRR